MRLYLDIDGTVLSHEDGDGPSGKAFKNGAIEFLQWAIKEFDVAWLSAWTPTDPVGIQRDLDPYLPPECRGLPALDFTKYKTEALANEDGDFLWADDVVLHAEWKWLDERDWSDRVILAKADDPSIDAIEKEIRQKSKWIQERPK